jgi:superkiller protein 3
MMQYNIEKYLEQYGAYLDSNQRQELGRLTVDSLYNAELYYKQALDIDPSYEDANYDLGLVYQDLELYTESAEYLRRALRSDRKNAQYMHSLGETLWLADWNDEAYKVFQEALKLDNENDDLYYHIGQIQYERKYYDDAAYYLQTAFKKAIELEIDPSFYYHKLGHIYEDWANDEVNNELFESAILYFKKASDLNPADDSYLADLSRLYSNDSFTPDYGLSIRYLSMALSLDSIYAPYAHDLGHLYQKIERYDSAMYFFQYAVSLDRQPSYLNEVGDVYNKVQQPDSARLYYKWGILQDSTYLGNFEDLGDLWYELKNYDSAILFHTYILARTTKAEDKASYYSRLGYDYLRKGDYPASWYHFTQQLQFDPAGGSYNLACWSALTDPPDVASSLKALEAAFLAGYRDFTHVRTNSDLESIRIDPQFEALMKKHESAVKTFRGKAVADPR